MMVSMLQTRRVFKPAFAFRLFGWMVFLGIGVALLTLHGLAASPDSDEMPDDETVQAPATLPVTPMLLSGHRYMLEVVSTPAQAETGLMYRTSLATGHGMLFPFVPPRKASFWMRNTLIPLDMIFLRNHKVIYIEHAAPPCEMRFCTIYGPEQPVDLVIELPANTAVHDHIKVGDILLKPVLLTPPTHTGRPFMAPRK